MILRWVGKRPGVLLLGTLVFAPPVAAQISPGELSRPHRHLEGSANCLECHESRKGVAPAKCLSCHDLLATRIESGKGLHARPEYADCKTCHIEHHGAEFELIWWGDEGFEAFDHRLTGFEVEGAHASLTCRRCHRADSVREPKAMRRRDIDLDRSFLGLASECRACHEDEHRGQFDEASCLTCHDQNAWVPSVGFDHHSASFPLTGLHRNLACEECHAQEPDSTGQEGETFTRFVGLSFQRCDACHRDPHQARFGAECEACHQTGGWMVLDDRAFDHDLTRYRLEGRHRGVACEGCHRPGEPRRGVSYSQCTDCHRDEHLGQLADRQDGGACESCHTVDGFTPSLFGREEHQAVYALDGGHQGVACESCHRLESRAQWVGRRAAGSPGTSDRELTVRLRFASTRCVRCHRDPHEDPRARFSPDAGCEGCHRVGAWDQVEFDHGLTGFELDRAHAPLTCVSCHSDSEEAEVGSIRFGGVGTTCAACHVDPHEAQFNEGGDGTRCERCHEGSAWRPPSAFDHDSDSRWPLEGAHRIAPCEQCHRKESGATALFTRYRPLSRQCSSCHAREG